MKIASLPATLLAIVSTSTPAWSFAEDACYSSTPPYVVNCTPLPSTCTTPFPNTTAACRRDALATFNNQDFPDGGRSTIHVDATYVMAHAVGFDEESAYWIAAYNEVTDLGWFEPRTMTNAAYGGGQYRTATLDGYVRTDLANGGVFHHFGPPSSPTTAPQGLHPAADDPTVEPMLAHLRAWALAGTGATRPDCTAGITARSSAGDFATGSSCYLTASGAPATVNARIAALGPVAVPFAPLTGAQAIVLDANAAPVATSVDFDAIVGAQAASARLGIYLHTLGDRISHHVCLDRSSLSGPSADGASFTAAIDDAECVQTLHSVRHLWEVGVDFDALAPTDRTTIAGLDAVYDELVAFARARGVLAAGADSAQARQTLVSALAGALQTPAADARMLAVRDVGCARGTPAFKGLPACPTPSSARTRRTSAALTCVAETPS